MFIVFDKTKYHSSDTSIFNNKNLYFGYISPLESGLSNGVLARFDKDSKSKHK